MLISQRKSNSTKYLTPLTPAQLKDVQDLIIYTEANRKPLRKPRIRRRDPNSTPRPVNCFLVYRKEKQAQIAELCVGANHRVISKIVARWWKNIDEPTRALYVDVAKQVKIDHAVKFPDYKYTPKRKQNSTNHENIKPNTRQSVTPANDFYRKLDENNLSETTTAVIQRQPKSNTTQSSSYNCEMTKPFIEMMYDPQSFPVPQENVSNAPPLSQPLVDDSLAQYMKTQQWQTQNNSNPAFNQVMIPPQTTFDSIANSNISTALSRNTHWDAAIDPLNSTMQQRQQDTIYPFDLVDQSSTIGFNALGYGLNDTYWPLDTASFMTVNNNNILDIMCTPDLLAENDSPLSASLPYCHTTSLCYGNQYDFIHPNAAFKAISFSSSSSPSSM